jgi:hypothetical protein
MPLKSITLFTLVSVKTGDKNSLIVARALVDPSNCILPLRIVNTSNTETVIYANTRLATCQAYSSVMKLNADWETEEGIRMMRKVDEIEHNLERNDDKRTPRRQEGGKGQKEGVRRSKNTVNSQVLTETNVNKVMDLMRIPSSVSQSAFNFITLEYA